MPQTLKNRRSSRQINERLQQVDARLLAEANHAGLLLEAMDEQDLQRAGEIINKLRKVKGKGVKSLDQAIEKAESQLNKYTGGGPLTKAWTKLKGIAGFDNPLVKFMTFANALEQGFRQMPQIFKNNIDVDISQNLDKPLSQLVTDPDKQKTLLNNMLKALSPSGFFGAFKKVPYVDKNVLVQELMQVPLKNFAAIAQAINSGPNTQQVADDVKDVAQGGGDVASKGTSGTDPTQPAAGTAGTVPGKGTTQASPAAATGETPDRKATKVADSIYKELGTSLIDAGGDERRVKAMLKLLADEDKLKA